MRRDWRIRSAKGVVSPEKAAEFKKRVFAEKAGEKTKKERLLMQKNTSKQTLIDGF